MPMTAMEVDRLARTQRANRASLSPRHGGNRLAALTRRGDRFMATSDLAASIGRTLLFQGVDPDDMRRLAAISRETMLQPNQVLFDQGDESDGLYLIISGIIRVYLSSDDTREATINLLED